jgi:uncharacterized membrane protein
MSQWRVPVVVGAVVALALWPAEIKTAFGLPAHPLIIHVPVVFIPILGLAALVVAIRRNERYDLPLAAFSVLTLAATQLAVGAGEAFREIKVREEPRLRLDPTLHDHADAGLTVRLTMVLLTALLVAMPFASRWPRAVTIGMRVLIGLLALTAILFTIRTGHLGAKLAWGDD